MKHCKKCKGDVISAKYCKYFDTTNSWGSYWNTSISLRYFLCDFLWDHRAPLNNFIIHFVKPFQIGIHFALVSIFFLLAKQTEPLVIPNTPATVTINQNWLDWWYLSTIACFCRVFWHTVTLNDVYRLMQGYCNILACLGEQQLGPLPNKIY